MNPVNKARSHAGFSLVEVMVAVLIGTILSAAALGVLITSRRTYNVQSDLTELQENARFALHAIAYDLRMAGFFGCADSPTGVTVNLNVNPGDLYDVTPGGAGNHVQGLEGLEGDDAPNYQWYPSGSLLDIPPTIGGINHVAGTDMLTIRRFLAQPTATLDTSMADNTSAVSIPAGNTLNRGTVLAVSDCNGADLFQLDSTTAQADGQLTHGTGQPILPDNSSPSLFRSYQQNTARVYRYRGVRYFIGTDPGTGNPGLYRMVTVPRNQLGIDVATTATELLVDGVEQLQATYGEAGAGGTLLAYRTADQVQNWDSVKTVRVGLLVRTVAPARGAASVTQTTFNVNDKAGLNQIVVPNDRRSRRVFTMTVSVRNRP